MSGSILFGQEVLLPLQVNPLVEQRDPSTSINKTSSLGYIEVDLNESKIIILDDFSYNFKRPSEKYWEDDNVYINRTFGRNPNSIGVATFDGLDRNGYPYEFDDPTSYGSCDTLTSLPIELGEVDVADPNNPDDTVYLSFSFQPQGMYPFANTERDSIILQFKDSRKQIVYDTVYMGAIDPVDSTVLAIVKEIVRREVDVSEWIQVWTKEGSEYYKDASDIPIFLHKVVTVDPSLYKDGFQFRFISFGNTSGALDQWHLDNIYMSSEKKINHINTDDIAFRQETGSKLHNYESMPWFHYYHDPASFVDDSRMQLRLSSSFGISELVDFEYRMYDEGGVERDGISQGGSGTTLPSNSFSQVTMPLSTDPEHDFFFPTDNLPRLTTTYFRRENILTKRSNPEDDLFKGNNKLVEYQVFGSYYAYDDGTAEAGYGIKSTNDGCVAVKFELPDGITDTLTAIYMYFNPVVVNREGEKFKLTVWNDFDGRPGTSIGQNSSIDVPVYPKKGENYYVRLSLDNPITISGSFYVGWQKNTQEVLNVGYDVNRNARDVMFYSLDGSCNTNLNALWVNSANGGSVQQDGALMIRPAFKNMTEPIVGVGPERKTMLQNPVLKLYPNPASSYITLSISGENDGLWYCQIFNTNGQLLVERNILNQENIDVTGFQNGMYLVHLADANSDRTLKSKFLVRK